MRTALPSHFIPSTHGTAVLRAADPLGSRRFLPPAAGPVEVSAAGLLDALPHPALLLDELGRVTHLNLAWREARQRRLVGGGSRVNDDFVAACDGSQRWAASGPALARALRAVLSGERERFEMPFGDGCRVFVARTGRGVVVVQHQG